MAHKRSSTMKVFALMLTLMLVFTIMPATAFAEGTASAGGIKVYMTVSNQGKIADTKDGEPMAWKEVAVTDLNGNGEYTFYEALVAAHKAYNTESGFACAEDGWVTAVWGVENNWASYSFLQNNKATGLVTTAVIKDGDHLVASVNQDTAMYSDWASYFDAYEQDAAAGETITFSLKGFPAMSVNEPVAGKNITVGIWENGKLVEKGKTDDNGKVSIKFDKVGTYIITAEGSAEDTLISRQDEYGYWSPYMPVPGAKDKEGKDLWGQVREYNPDYSPKSYSIGYTEADYKDGPYPYKEVKWLNLEDFDPATFNQGHLMYVGDVLYDCPIIAPCCIVTVERAVVAKQAQKLTVKAKNQKVKASKLKKKAVSINAKKLVKITKAKGTISFKGAAADKKSKKVLKFKKGKVIIKKGTKKGKYTLKLAVTAKGNGQYKKAKKTVKVKIVVK